MKRFSVWIVRDKDFQQEYIPASSFREAAIKYSGLKELTFWCCVFMHRYNGWFNYYCLDKNDNVIKIRVQSFWY